MPELPIIIAAIILNLLLLIGLIVLVPRLLRRQENRAAEEATRLREMLLDVLSEQEAVTVRQSQIGSSLATIREQIGNLSNVQPQSLHVSAGALTSTAGLSDLERRLEALQGQLGSWFATVNEAQRDTQRIDNQNWGNVLGLLANMQDRIATLNSAVEQRPQASMAADQLLQELDKEMQSLRVLADEIAGLQWKLRRSVLERETSLAALRSQVLGVPKVGHRAA